MFFKSFRREIYIDYIDLIFRIKPKQNKSVQSNAYVEGTIQLGLYWGWGQICFGLLFLLDGEIKTLTYTAKDDSQKLTASSTLHFE